MSSLGMKLSWYNNKDDYDNDMRIYIPALAITSEAAENSVEPSFLSKNIISDHEHH